MKKKSKTSVNSETAKYETLFMLAKGQGVENILPKWFKDDFIGPFSARVSSVFVIYGDINGLSPNPDVLDETEYPYLELPNFLSKIGDSAEICVFYDIANGARFLNPKMKDKFMELAEIKADSGAIPSNPIEVAKAKLGTKRSIPREPELCLPLIEKVLKKQEKTVIIISSANFIFPMANNGLLPSNERVNIERLKNWVSDDEIRNNNNLIILTTNQLADISNEIRQPGISVAHVFIPRPDFKERNIFIDTSLMNDRELKLSASVEEFTIATQGLNLNQIRDIFLRARSDGRPVSLKYIKERKNQILNSEYGDILEVVDAEHSLDDIGGLDHIKRECRTIISAIKIGETKLIPSGITLMGPPGTGKTAFVEGFAKEAEYNFVKIKNLRSKWVGDSEAKSERLRSALLSLAPVVVMNDESDLGGMNRDDPKGDSGVSERLMRDWMQLLSDPRIVGKILVINCTNRIDRMDSALKRSGRSDDRWLLPMPSSIERKKIFEIMFNRLEKIPTDIEDFGEFANLTGDVSGADIRKIVKESYKVAVSNGKNKVSAEFLKYAIGDFIPNANQRDIDMMHILGILESSSRRMLPPNTPDIIAGIRKRGLLKEIDLLLEQIKDRNILEVPDLR